MRLCSSGRYDANDIASHRVSDEDHSAIDQTEGVETQLSGGIEIVKLDHVWIQELPWPPFGKSTPCFFRLASFLASKSITGLDFEYTDIQYLIQGLGVKERVQLRLASLAEFRSTSASSCIAPK